MGSAARCSCPVKCFKVRYRDRVAAALALAKIQRQGKSGHTERRAYRCPNCKGWHLTSSV